MIHVFVESNWVVDVCAPAFRRTKEALLLLELAASRMIDIHVPHIALREAQSVIKRKRRVQDLDVLRQFRTWAVSHRQFSSADADVVNRFLADLSSTVSSEIDQLDDRIEEVARSVGVHVFALDDAMLERSISLRTEVPEPQLKPFDETILAAVLVRAEALPDQGLRVFCTTDFDLAPIVKKGTKMTEREYLKAVYDAARIEMRTGFNLHDLLAKD